MLWQALGKCCRNVQIRNKMPQCLSTGSSVHFSSLFRAVSIWLWSSKFCGKDVQFSYWGFPYFSWRCCFQQQKSCSGKPDLKRVCIGVGVLGRQQCLQWFPKQHHSVGDYTELYHLSERIRRWISVKPSSEKLCWRSPMQRPGGIRLISFSLNVLVICELSSN